MRRFGHSGRHPQEGWIHGRRFRVLILVLCLVGLAAGCGGEKVDSNGAAGSESPQTGGTVALLIDFESVPPDGAPLETLTSTTGDAQVQIVQSGSGVVRMVPDPSEGTAAEFPNSAQVAAGDLAVLNVTPLGQDTLAPKEGAFQFGVDVMYPEGAAGDTAGDDGDNLMQRGLFGDQGQYKLQVDHERPACRIASEQGEVLVKSKLTLASGKWYRLLCQRADDRVTLFVAELDDTADDDLVWKSWTTDDVTGSLPEGESGPASLSVGGKLNTQGGIVEDAPDQFSGVLDNVVFRALPA